MLSVSEHCHSCLVSLREVISILSHPDRTDGRVKHAQVNEELDRFSLFIGNIGALHRPESSLSIESRLEEADDILTHILNLLADLNEAARELLDIVSEKREGMVSVIDAAEEENNEQNSEVNELREEISGTITRLFRVSTLIRQAAPTDIFTKALSRNRYRFNDQFDIAHVGEKYPKLATDDRTWLRQRLGRAITQRRHYLGYIQDHHEQLDGMLTHDDKADSSVDRAQALMKKHSLASKPMLDTASRTSFFTKATTVAPDRITSQMLVAEESDPEDDARSYTTVSRSVDGDQESLTAVRIPKLDELRIGNKKEIECPFCFRIKRFKNERTWRKHVFSDLRAYVCTFPDCDAPYFGDINKWFQHEMMFHRVDYKCFLCPNTVFYQEEKYLSHLKRKHAEILEDGEDQPGTDLARKPLAQIPASDCPCCSEWVDRLKERAIQPYNAGANDILAVVPTVFKRHLAGHLEQLALFAVPIGATTDGDDNSNAAIEEIESKRTDASQLSTLTFASSPGDLDDAIPERGRCPLPECGGVHEDLKAHMLTHQTERPETCPITTCEYHVKGFVKKRDKIRHTLTHYRGTLVCSFCPGQGSAAEKTFNRPDVFKRHLTAVHGVDQTPPNSRKKSTSSSKAHTGLKKVAGTCSTCSETFANAQEFYEHLDDCVLRVVQQADPVVAVPLAAEYDDMACSTCSATFVNPGDFYAHLGDCFIKATAFGSSSSKPVTKPVDGNEYPIIHNNYYSDKDDKDKNNFDHSYYQ
ncbi:hypothetical protein BDV95DRAFT_574620 [Massariosphaeria phaeospora]|uniref:C2H2-type domain-containing protein n=1 Tax=Massariosphaeria phaeospora TaxID=100035 RepID=A0A7C8MDQ9_9PLEO|nr:hypothetical protein BDV95DRAFT_574620 [Massariosphaeria phaeospora]